MGVAEDSMRSLLRSTERVDIALEAESLPPSAGVRSGLEGSSTRTLSVVFHVGAFGGTEEGSVFICKRIPYEEDDTLDDLEIERIIPITHTFSVKISQTRRNTVDQSTAASAMDRSAAGFLLTIHPGDKQEDESLTFFTNDTQTLRAFVAECNRLRDQAPGVNVVGTYEQQEPFTWLRHYLSRSKAPQSISSMAWDLREINRPLETRLSTAAVGAPGDDRNDAILIQRDWVQMKARQAAHQGESSLKFRFGTFNVNGHIPSQDLSSWIQGKSSEEAKKLDLAPPSPLGSGTFPPSISQALGDPESDTQTPQSAKSDLTDVYVLGFQELDLSAEALIYSTNNFREEAYTKAILAALGEKAVLYEKLASKQLVGMLTLTFVKKSLRGSFSDVQTATIASGILGILANKGATGLRFVFTPPSPNGKGAAVPTIFTFVNAHLAAFDEMYDKRNLEFNDISRRLTFPSGVMNSLDNGNYTSETRYSIYDSDVLVWLVHLNYRIDLPDQEIRQTLTSEYDDKLQLLLYHDQLHKAIRNKKAFVGFSEKPIAHMPTYRFAPGLPTDALGYDTKRKPAWTDRILYMHEPSITFEQSSYDSYPNITMSDHRPLAADVQLKLPLYEKSQLDLVARNLFHEVDALEHPALQPSIRVDVESLDLGLLSYHRQVESEFRIENNGKVACAFRFISPEPEAPLHPNWLRVQPLAGVIFPGETALISVKALADDKVASKLNVGLKDISTTLVVRAIYGRDTFVPVKATWVYTAFATSLGRLARFTGAAQNMKSKDDLLPDGKARNAPKEIMRLINWLMGPEADLSVLYTDDADDNLIGIIREFLDNGDEFSFEENEDKKRLTLAFGEALLSFLKALPEPLIPYSIQARCAQVTDREEAFELFDIFPPATINVWISLTAFLHFVCQVSEDPETRVKTIVTLFTPVLLPDNDNFPVSPLAKRRFLAVFLQ